MQLKQLLMMICVLTAMSLSQAYAFSVPRPDPSDPITVIEGLKAEKQQEKSWCWAATSKMLISSKNPSGPSQCGMASTVFERDCCTSNRIHCNQGYNMKKALTKLGYTPIGRMAEVNPTAHWSQRYDNRGWYQSVVESIKNKVPVAITINTLAGSPGNSSHAVVAYGTYRKGSTDYIIVFDPWDGQSKYWDFSYVTGFMAWLETHTLE